MSASATCSRRCRARTTTAALTDRQGPLRRETTMAKTQITAEPGIPQIIMTCEFDAPRDLVYRAYTEPELIQQWLGPREYTTTVKENVVRDGGKWRFVHTDAGGHRADLRVRGRPWPRLDGDAHPDRNRRPHAGAHRVELPGGGGPGRDD